MKHEWIDVKGDRVAMIKKKSGWRVVYPTRNEDGSRNWANTLYGGKANLRLLIISIVVISFILFGFYQQVIDIENQYEKIANDPFDWCSGVNNGSYDPFEYGRNQLANFTLVK